MNEPKPMSASEAREKALALAEERAQKAAAENQQAPADVTLRGLTRDGAFRVIAARMSGTVRAICQAQGAKGSTAQALGDLLVSTVIFRETMSPGLLVQGIFKDGNGSTLVADSAPEGQTRGLVQLRGEQVEATSGGYLQMMRTLQNGSVNQGIVELKVGETLTQGAMTYMQQSEQVDSMLAVATTLDEDGDVLEAGGYMVQLLPELGRGPLAVMTERLEEFRTIDRLLKKNFDAAWFMDEILYAMPYTRTDTSKVEFHCWCSHQRMLSALATLPKHELQSMVDEGAPIEIDCDYCGAEYKLAPQQLKGLLTAN